MPCLVLKAREASEKQARSKAREAMLAEAEQNRQRLQASVSPALPSPMACGAGCKGMTWCAVLKAAGSASSVMFVERSVLAVNGLGHSPIDCKQRAHAGKLHLALRTQMQCCCCRRMGQGRAAMAQRPAMGPTSRPMSRRPPTGSQTGGTGQALPSPLWARLLPEY